MKARVLTALALIPVVLAVVFCTSPWPVVMLSLGAGLVSLAELSRLTGTATYQAFFWFAFCFLFSSQNSWFASSALSLPALLVDLLVLGCWATWLSLHRKSFSYPFVGAFIPAGLWSIVLVHGFQGKLAWDFASPVLLILFPLWAGDTAAIFAGRAFGKHLLAPSISPKKTVEGSAANLLFSIGFGIVTSLLIHRGPWLGLTCGAAVGVFGQLGDLFESALKRKAEVKDSGTLLPGHGGLLDRIDSLLFAAPVVGLVLRLWPPGW